MITLWNVFCAKTLLENFVNYEKIRCRSCFGVNRNSGIDFQIFKPRFRLSSEPQTKSNDLNCMQKLFWSAIDRTLASNSEKEYFLDAKPFPHNKFPLFNPKCLWNDASNQIFLFSPNNVMVNNESMSALLFKLSL